MVQQVFSLISGGDDPGLRVISSRRQKRIESDTKGDQRPGKAKKETVIASQ